LGGKDRRRGEPRFDFLLSAAKRDTNAAKRLFGKALSAASHPQPRVINTDLAPIYNSAIPAIRKKARYDAAVVIDPSNTWTSSSKTIARSNVGSTPSKASGNSRGSTNHSGL
jgi:transposase-like protein